MKTVLISLLVGLVGGFGGGWTYQSMQGSTTTKSEATSSTTASTKTLAECLTDVWGADKYAAITANPSLATTEDNFQALTCYEAK